MSSVCKSTPGITNVTELVKEYPNSILKMNLERNSSDARLTTNALDSIYVTLVSDGKLVSEAKYKQMLVSISSQKDKVAQQKILESVGAQEKQTMEAIQSEFCFNYVRYKYALEDLFETLTRTSVGSSLTEPQKKSIEDKIGVAKDLNMKLNDLIQLTNYIATKRASEMRNQNSHINLLNDSIKDIYGRLQVQNQILQKEGSITDLRKRMVEFTEEKNQSASNLLNLYGFLNLVALGLLFYAARS